MIAPYHLSLALALCLPSSTLRAQETPEAKEVIFSAPIMTGDDFLDIRSAGFDSSMTSPKDAAYLGALKMLIGRLTELPIELGEQSKIPPAAIPLLERLVYGQFDLRVGSYDRGVDAPLPIYARLELDKQAGYAPFADLLTNLLMQVGMPLGPPDAKGHVALPLPLPVPVWFADVDGNFVLEIGSVPPRPEVSEELHLPGDAHFSGKVRLDFDQLAATIRGFIESDSDLAEFDEFMANSQLGGQVFEFLSGSDDKRSITLSAMRNWGTTPASQIYKGGTVSAAALSLVPADVEWAAVGSADFSAFLDYMQQIVQQATGSTDQFVDMLGPMIGLPEFNIRRDLTEHMGISAGSFASRAAGGGLYSTVAFLSLTDSAAFAATLDQLEDHFMAMTESELNGYFRFNRYDYQGVAMTSFQFPGLPVPFEPAYGIDGEHLIMGLSAQAVEAAFQHAHNGQASLTSVPGFMEQVGGDLPTALSVFYFDVPGLIDDGYFVMDMWTNMLANGVRSRAGMSKASREPGRLLPSLSELKQGALPLVSISWLKGDDALSEMRADRSILVNTSAVLPYVAKIYAPLFGAMAAVLASSRIEDGSDLEDVLEDLFD